MKILFIVPYPTGVAASQRFRFEQYYAALHERNIEFETAPFLDEKTWDVIYLKGSFFIKFKAIFTGLFRRFLLLFSLSKFDYVFIHRESLPIGPPVFEWFLSKVFKKRVIYDFDDAIWIENTSGYNSLITLLKRFSNFYSTCKWSYKISAGNHYLQAYASTFNSQSFYNPTVVDTDHYHNRSLFPVPQKYPCITIGWTGSHSTIRYLDNLLPVFEKLEEKFNFRLMVIADKVPKLQLRSLVYKQWSKATEIEDLLHFDIGIMPLDDDKWANGKCGFKAIQYMALDIPALVSPVGVNSQVVDHGKNGYLCNTNDEWYAYLSLLLSDRQLIDTLSQQTRAKIVKNYSVKANQAAFLNLFS